MHRVAVVGGPGSAKSTVAAALAMLLDAPHVELDGLWWRPGWVPSDLSLFRERVSELADSDVWVMDGNYLDEVGRDVVWPRADTLVWLDPPRRLAVARTLRRAVVRVIWRRTLWGTNRQGVSTLSPSSIVRLVRRWPAYSHNIDSALQANAYPTLTVVRLRSESEVRQWLQAVEQHR